MDIITPWDNDRPLLHTQPPVLSALSCYNVIITPLSSGQWKLNCPQATLFHLRGCIILPLGCLDLRSTASFRQDNAPLRWNNVSSVQYNFHWPGVWYCIFLNLEIYIFSNGTKTITKEPGTIFVDKFASGLKQQQMFRKISNKWRQKSPLEIENAN